MTTYVERNVYIVTVSDIMRMVSTKIFPNNFPPSISKLNSLSFIQAPPQSYFIVANYAVVFKDCLTFSTMTWRGIFSLFFWWQQKTKKIEIIHAFPNASIRAKYAHVKNMRLTLSFMNDDDPLTSHHFKFFSRLSNHFYSCIYKSQQCFMQDREK